MDKHVLRRAVSFIDSWLQYRYENLEIPGFVVAIAHEGKVVFNHAYGYANLEKHSQMKTDHIFRIASHSKTFTAAAIMQLAEEKLLTIDDCVTNHIPWLRNHADSRMNQITLRQLLCHSAGIIRDGGNANFWQLTDEFPAPDQFKECMMEANLVVDNNQEMKYSNFGYSLLGIIVEQVSGIPFNRYVQEKIIQPLGLADTGPEFIEDIIPRLVTGYTRRDFNKERLSITEQIDTKAMSSATGFYSTTADLCRYFQAYLDRTGELLNNESKKEMQRSQWRVNNTQENEEYGLGFSIDYLGNRQLIGHGGSFPGQRTRTFCDPKAKLIVVILTNCIDGEAKTMGKGIISIIDHFEKSEETTEASSIEQLRQFQGRFSELWGELEIVENGRNLVAINPNSWFPFKDEQRIGLLEKIDKRTLKLNFGRSKLVKLS